MQQYDPPTNLFYLAGAWIAQCAACGYEVAQATRQDRAERKAARRPCPVCVEAA